MIKIIYSDHIEYKDSDDESHNPHGPAWKEAVYKEYCIHGNTHNIVGPAVFWRNSSVTYEIDGNRL